MSARDATGSGPTGASSGAPTGFSYYLVTQAAWFLAFGLQMVLFPYLVRVVLQEDEIRFGLAQMALQLPTVLLILLGGYMADRVDTLRAVLVGCGLCALSFLALGVFVAGGRLTYATVILYALGIGTIGAFVTPARDALLSRVAPGGVQQAVGMASLAQFGGQIAGMAAATAAPVVGLTALLFGQAAMMTMAAGAALKIRPRPAGPPRTREGGALGFIFGEIRGGFRAAAASPVIAPVILCAAGMGVCFMGAFSVLLPLIVESYFPGDLTGPGQARIATALGVFSITFWIGSILSTTVLIRFGDLRRKGRAYLAALVSGAMVLILCSLPMPFWMLCGLNFIWGLGGGVAMTLGRGLVQRFAPPDKMARILSIFTLANLGGAPAGAVLYGVLAHAIGPRAAILFPGLGMMAIVAAVALRSELWRLEESGPVATPGA
ncbi:MAG: MFS transporter [Phenylobacterium sp.]|uniref:MFS transporter n=2 Tax=Phenylobacterium sp. TaxID=1871053 RepID=UPI0025E21856|nr:MFS transporter [Phenylobacterium sp.]MCA6226105.1 MFS transporter [Phenylobacterium sp.]MCA6232301.1 MFS transporter [Phenylobacterium sp.]MCA6234933.1 MFS transporter [Phenylobacterium sp.]MCA6256974.1 MFS transporter [Phenylobacterium sp.]MCA6264352.1 MFS transporter [Phenylobacterium sp.]